MTVGDAVRARQPFSMTFAGEYVIEREEGGVSFIVGIEGGLVPECLEPI